MESKADKIANCNLADLEKHLAGCECGKSHRLETREVIVGRGVIEKLAGAIAGHTPKCSGIILMGEKNELFYRVDKILTRASFRVRKVFDEGKGLCAAFNDSDCNISDEGLRLIVCIGKFNEAKMIASGIGLPIFLVADSPNLLYSLARTAEVHKEGLFGFYPVRPPVAIVCDFDCFSALAKANLMGAYGEIVSKLIALFDSYYNEFILGNSSCPLVREAALNIITLLVDGASAHMRGEGILMSYLSTASLRLSMLSQAEENCVWLVGGAEQAAASLTSLFKYEQRECRSSGEHQFLAANVLIKLYKNALVMRKVFTPPPDNNKRMEALAENYGISEVKASCFLRPLISGKELSLICYRLSEYNVELSDIIEGIYLYFAKAYKTFKRLYSDDGFSLLNYFDSLDMSLCIGIAPDVVWADTLLTYMKNQGLLENYIL